MSIMSTNTHIPATVVKTSNLPIGTATHLIGVDLTTSTTVRVPTTSVLVSTEAYVNPSWIVSLDYSKLTNTPEPLPDSIKASTSLHLFYNY